MIGPARGKHPQLGKDVFVAPTAAVVGDVKLGESCSIWYGAVLRGDVMPIIVGDETNIQDNAVIHGTINKAQAILGNRVTVGHSAVLHGCKIGDFCLIGMGAIILDNAKISKNCIVGAGALVTENAEFPEGSLILGSPAKVKRSLTEKEIQFLQTSADNYLLYKTWYEGEDTHA